MTALPPNTDAEPVRQASIKTKRARRKAGSAGGLAGTGDAKRRGDSEYYSRLRNAALMRRPEILP